MRNKISKISSILLAVVLTVCCLPVKNYAEVNTTNIGGNVYYSDSDYDHDITEDELNVEEIGENNAFGTLALNGSISSVEDKDGITSYISDAELEVVYTYSDTLLTAAESEWHLANDSNDEIVKVDLKDDIELGAVLIQTSKDQVNWVTVFEQENIFSDVPIGTDAIYTISKEQIDQGCFFKVAVAYKLEKNDGSNKFLFFNIDDEKYVTEIYDFYVGQENSNDESTVNKKVIGETKKCDSYLTSAKGYSGNNEIDKDDDHYGWKLGEFTIEGYSENVQKDDKEVFLKNVGDEVKLVYTLNQNINALNGNEDLSIHEDEAGIDEEFQTEQFDFGKGCLIVSYTDYQNETHDNVYYTNYLSSVTTAGADSEITFYEEGDYKIALDYEIKNSSGISTYRHYKTYMEFSIRNGNCMIFPRDVETKSELTNSSLTEQGFYLDLANSRYLKINVKKESLVEGQDGLVEDTRFNRPAKDGEEFTEEGIYTIEAENEYTNQTTIKKIYVGSNNLLKAVVVNGLTYEEVKTMTANGIQVNDDGTLVEKTVQENAENIVPTAEQETSNAPIIIIIIVAIIAVATIVYFIVRKKKA